jgi:ADP-ribose pyrophosphatase YjhB (NUDIX family)
MANFPPSHCPYCGTALDLVDAPTVYRCEDCDDYVFHNAVLGGGAVVVDDDSVLLVEDFRGAGTWKVPEGVPEIPESPREGVARELAEETNLAVDPADLVYLYDVGKEVAEDKFRMHVYYGVDRADTTGPLEAGSDATDARFWTPEAFAASDHELRDMPNPDETRSWAVELGLLCDLTTAALDRETTYAALFAPYVE